MTSKTKVVSQIASLYQDIDVKAIPKSHKGNFNVLYETVIADFLASDTKARAISCGIFATQSESKVVPTSIAHTFRMKADNRYKVQLNADTATVYLIKPTSK
jgi:hypothetical protein